MTSAESKLALARAFRRHFEGMLAELGDWEGVGRELAEVWRRLDDESRESSRIAADAASLAGQRAEL